MSEQIPQRYVLGIMGFLGIIHVYMLRQCLNLAIVVMVEHHENYTKVDPYACPGEVNLTDDDEKVVPVYDWSEEIQGIILSSFYWGYVVSHIPGGIIAHIKGGKQTVGISILASAILTLLLPAAAMLGPYCVIGVRVLQGLFEGATFPAVNSLLSNWVPPLERAKIGTLVMAGVQVGIILGNVISGFVISLVSRWDVIFYLFGLSAIIWFIIWNFTVFNHPSVHPRITEKERLYLLQQLGNIQKTHTLSLTPWRRIFLSPAVIALIIGQIGHDWGLFTIQVDLPKYMSGVQKFPIHKNGMLSALPFIAMWIVAISSAWLSDYLLQREKWSITVARKVYASFASFGPAIGAIIASYAGCEKILVIFCFVLGMSLMGFYYPSLRVNALDIAPNNAGIVMSFVNGFGAIAGILSPIVTGFVTPNSTLLEWRRVFWINTIILVVTNVVFLAFGSAKQQSWDKKLEEPPRQPQH